MRGYVVWFSIAISLLVPLSGCSEPTANMVVGLDEEFTLSVGQSATIRGGNLSIEFVEVVSDSRCPTGATCIWAGEASCLVKFTDSGSTYRKVLTEPGSSSPPKASLTDYEIEFTLLPYPELGKETATKDYRLQLTVNKMQE